MSDCAILFALTVMAGMVAPLSGQDCDESTVNQCLRAFHALKDYRTYLVLDDVLPSWNETEVYQLCVSYDQFSVCMKTVTSHCSLNDRLTHAGLDDAYDYLCTESTIAEYLTYHECFGNTAVRRRVHFCNETFQSKTSSLHALSSTSEKSRQYCKYYDNYVDCVEAAVRPVCGDNASSWQKEYVTKLHQPALKYIGCSGGNSAGGGWSMVTIIITIFIVITIVLMVIVITVFLVVVRRRHRLSGRGRRRRSGSIPPDYDAPYVVYAAAGPDGERRLQMVGPDDGQPAFVGASAVPVYKGVFVQPPPYIEDQPPAAFAAVDQTPNTAQSAGENPGVETDSTSRSGTAPDADGTATDAVDLPPPNNSE